MASASYSDDLTCSICLAIFSDPVTVVCGHSFCRECITISLSSQLKIPQCPQCRTPILQVLTNLPTSHILKSLAEKVKEKARLMAEYKNDERVAELCPEHEEKLKLFCVTDQQLICVICREAARHQTHKFQPVKEAAESLKQELDAFIQQVSADIEVTEKKATAQREEMKMHTEKCQQLTDQISKQFGEMHKFLRKREKEIKNELKQREEEENKKMNKMLDDIETTTSGSRELKGKVESVLAIGDSEELLKNWSADKSVVSTKNSFTSRGQNFQVVEPCVSLGPYESHLQFLMWREMLGVIQHREEKLTLKSDGMATVSGDGRTLHFTSPYRQQGSYLPYSGTYNYTTINYASASSVNQFFSGKHYWDVEVRNRMYWELGVQKSFLKFDGQQYVTSQNARLQFPSRPQKIGIYLNCASWELSFYDAESLTHLLTMTCDHMPQSAHFRVGVDPNPLTVCYASDAISDDDPPLTDICAGVVA